ncbi:VOC family protein (plasmid) [Agrobacterium sp. 13-2099-1-2]|uniref:VOC family protein n=1 Tax=Agrobacterium sp. 13-2099-1-2 TaxID=1841651 RepID=UPI001146C0B0|nr:VOC family protein [Agrobacterium sp. 13-2099-1-2]UZX45657.1 VOC family protein [Agrobacterium sp. 13-2099-1-2]
MAKPDASQKEKMIIDHIGWACSDLEDGVQQISDLLGVRPIAGGSHKGNGTRNALLSLGPGQYLEIIGPDLQQDITGTEGEAFSKLQQNGLFTFCLASDNLSQAAAVVRSLGYDAAGPSDWARERPNGAKMSWRLLRFSGHKLGYFLPIFIDWMASPHPSSSAPTAGSLYQLHVLHPQAATLQRVYSRLGVVAATVEKSDETSISAIIHTDHGLVRLEPASFAS